MQKTITSVRYDKLNQYFEYLLQSIQDSISPYLFSNNILSLYLVGSSVNTIPRIINMKNTSLIVSDIDLLLFVVPGLSQKKMQIIFSAIINSRNNLCGPYKNIHIGCRIRPISSLRQTIIEYASWGEDITKNNRLVAGTPVFNNCDCLKIIEIPRELLFKNLLSKLWFVIYSYPNKTLTNQLKGKDALMFQARLAAAAVRIVFFMKIIKSKNRHTEQLASKGEYVEDSNRLWKSTFVRNSIEQLIQKGLCPDHCVDLEHRNYALEVLNIATVEILYSLGLFRQRKTIEFDDLNSINNLNLRKCANLIFTLVSMVHQLRVGDEDNIDSMALSFGNMLSTHNFLSSSGLQSYIKVENWLHVLNKFHKVQFYYISRNLLSYS